MTFMLWNMEGNSAGQQLAPWLREALQSLSSRVPPARLQRIDPLPQSRATAVGNESCHVAGSEGLVLKFEEGTTEPEAVEEKQDCQLKQQDEWQDNDPLLDVKQEKQDCQLKHEDDAVTAEPGGTRVKQEPGSESDNEDVRTEDTLSNDMGGHDAGSATAVKTECCYGEETGDLILKFEEGAEEAVKSEAGVVSGSPQHGHVPQSEAEEDVPDDNLSQHRQPVTSGDRPNVPVQGNMTSDDIVRRHACSLCNKSFTQRTSLNIHMRTHSGERPYCCGICNKSFTISSHLKIHTRTHTGQRPFSCDICSKSFTISSHLKIHKRTHSGERPYSCDICNKSFSVRGSLNLHRTTHAGDRPFSCDVCNKSFSTRSYVQKHTRTHTGERPYTCDICNRSFSFRGTLNTHMRTHTGERPYPCDICHKTYITRGSLKAHMRSHAAEQPFFMRYL